MSTGAKGRVQARSTTKGETAMQTEREGRVPLQEIADRRARTRLLEHFSLADCANVYRLRKVAGMTSITVEQAEVLLHTGRIPDVI